LNCSRTYTDIAIFYTAGPFTTQIGLDAKHQPLYPCPNHQIVTQRN